MAAQPPPDSADDPPPFPRVPAHAWAWLQRSRPVLAEVARRLTGGPPVAGFIDELRGRFEDEEFTRHVVLDAIADVAFAGRIPPTRPAGVSWDRGLTWWAAVLAGTTPAAFDAPATVPTAQRRLFDAEAGLDDAPSGAPAAQARPGARVRWLGAGDAAAAERQALAAALRELLHNAEGDAVPAPAVRRLLAAIEDDAL